MVFRRLQWQWTIPDTYAERQILSVILFWTCYTVDPTLKPNDMQPNVLENQDMHLTKISRGMKPRRFIQFIISDYICLQYSNFQVYSVLIKNKWQSTFTYKKFTSLQPFHTQGPLDDFSVVATGNTITYINVYFRRAPIFSIIL